MNRQTIVERVLCVLVPLLGFALIYGLPMLGMKVAVDHGWYVASTEDVRAPHTLFPVNRENAVMSQAHSSRAGAPCRTHPILRDPAKLASSSHVVGVDALDVAA